MTRAGTGSRPRRRAFGASKSITAREKQQKKRQTIQLNDLQKTQSLAYAHEIVNLLGFTSFNDTSLIKHDSFQSNTKQVMTYLMEKT